ncbi:response regulator [Aurantibacillus circumpalustris]|uniref:response regulator n=1 Tax=Aurantibacillus circumpalustris TaxID=3036359 RepID=UPI00295A608C|nr:response regulator [Aurantibacillus circumpalustris]
MNHPIPKITNQDPVGHSTPRVIIIDDSPDNIKIVANILSQEGYEVLTALDAKKGLLIAETKLPDLILLDIMMPEMNGFEVCSLLKANDKTKETPIIFLTGATDSESILNGLLVGAADYITKPIKKQELLARVKNQLKFKMSSEYVGALFESRYHSIITFNKKFEIVNFNKISNERELLFNKINYKKGESILQHVPTANQRTFISKAEGVFKGKTNSYERNYTLHDKDIWFDYQLEPIHNMQGEIIGCVINGTDVTEKKEYALRANEYHRKIKETYAEAQESLSYASYIQKSIYPESNDLNKQFPEHFILFKSKEKVSGDLYWSYNFGNKDLIVIGDCTGHGVPGALLTTISIVLLERIVKYNNITSPNKILSEIDTLITETLKQKEGGLKVGLEMAVCLFDRDNGTLEYAGAKRPLIMAHGEDLFEIKADRFDIGGGGEAKIFKNHLLYPVKGSSLYMFSDGMVDQIGGVQHKKFKKKNLQTLIQTENSKPMNQQKLAFEKSISEWMGLEEQTDDILLMGIKI